MSKSKKQSTRKKTPTLQQAFLAASTEGDLVEQVRLARPKARELVWACGIAEDNIESIGHLAGDFCPEVDDSTRARAHDPVANAEWEAYCHHLNAAFALGIAIGQLVSPDVFKSGGER